MKIRNVELRTSQRSVGSVDSLSLEEPTVLTVSSRNNPDAMEEAVQSLSLAMKELHTELRDKTTECEVIYETANALSSALKESEQLLAEKTLECEQLALKLQMVTFREVDDDPMTLLVEENSADSTKDIIEEAEEMLARSTPLKGEATLTTIAGSSKPARVLSSENKSSTGIKKMPPGSSSTSTSSSNKSKVPTKSRPMDEVSQNERCPGPVSVDDEFMDDDETASSGESPVPTGVRQAHFYQVIQERDKALQTVKKLSKEIKHARKKNDELKSRLDRSTVLNELAYLKQSPSTRKKRSFKQESPQLLSQIPRTPAEPPEFQLGVKSPGKSRQHVAWQLLSLRRGKDTEEKDEHISVLSPTDAVNFGKNAVADQEYIKAIASNDADRAAGFDFERTTL